MEKFNVWRDTAASWSLIYFGRVWMRKGWEEDRVGLWKQVLELLVVWQLGERRSGMSMYYSLIRRGGTDISYL